MTKVQHYPTATQLLEDAASKAGLEDFGAGDFRGGLELLLESLDRDCDIPLEDVSRTVDLIRRHLINRLEIEEWYRAQPELDQMQVENPVSVIGLPRTGTTALGSALSQDDQFRSLRVWEQEEPCPPQILGKEEADPRRRAALEREAPLSAELRAMHIFEVDASTEDTEVLGLGFRARQMTLPVFGYHDWWRDTDMRDTYAYHRRVAVMLQSKRPPNRWLFEAPHHKFHLEDLLSAYPDAKFVMAQRDPAKVVAPYANFVAALFPGDWRAHNDPAKLGAHISQHLRIGMERAISARSRIGGERFLDVHHREFIRDPHSTMRRIYEFLGMDLRPEVWRRMEKWLVDNRPTKQGVHRYSPEQYGLSKQQIRSDYDFYVRHFDVELED